MGWLDIKGHNDQIEALRCLYKNKRLAQSFLFFGPQAVGKKMVALELAGLLLCKNPQVDQACGVCFNCKAVLLNKHPDLSLISKSGFERIKIEEVSLLKARFALSGYTSLNKVAVIDNAHMLTNEAANCLLKIMEEPPDNSTIILITHKIQECPQTIISRCQRLFFPPLSFKDIDSLNGVELGSFLFKFSQGCPGYALSLKKEGLEQKRREVFSNIVGYNEPLQMDHDEAEEFLQLMLYFFRDALVFKAKAPNELLTNSDMTAEIEKLSNLLSFEGVTVVINRILEALTLNKDSANTRILMSWVMESVKEQARVSYAG